LCGRRPQRDTNDEQNPQKAFDEVELAPWGLGGCRAMQRDQLAQPRQAEDQLIDLREHFISRATELA
jgi:hypothetical protein